MASKLGLRTGCLSAVVLALFLVSTGLAQEGTSRPKGLEPSWSLGGAWTGVASDEDSGTVYVLDRGGRCLELDSAGKTRREIQLPEDTGSLLRLARLHGDGDKALLTFGAWVGELRAYDASGAELWKYQSGINDVWAADLDGDGSDEVIIGFNASAGLHVLDNDGQLLWKSRGIGNVWNVCAGDVTGEGVAQVVSTSSKYKVHVFGSDGKTRRDLDAGRCASMVRIAKLSDRDESAMILAAGRKCGFMGFSFGSNKDVILVGLSGDGTRKWSLELPACAPFATSACVAPGQPWLAVGTRGGRVFVVDIERGESIASVSGQGSIPEVGWVRSDDAGTPLLLVATGSELNAFRVAGND